MDIKKKLINKNIILVGGGQLGNMALDLWPSELKLPTLILDKMRRGYIAGIPVVDIKDHKVLQTNIYILSYFKESAEGVNRLFSEVFKQELITVYDLLTSYSSEVFSNGWIGDPKAFEGALKNAEYFFDNTSKNVFISAARWRYLRELTKDYPVGPEIEKYRLDNYGINDKYYDFIIDAGSYDLSFLVSLRSNGVGWGNAIALEPDPNTHVKIALNANSFKKDFDDDIKFKIDNRALWVDSNGCNFYANGLLSARVASCENSDTWRVPSISLADLLDEIGASADRKILIKLHIEGAEWPVINSSSELIGGSRNIDFLINLSHDENSLIKIPAFFHQLNNHDLIIRSHSLFGEGLTLCARSRRN